MPVILIVDDNVINRILLSEIVEHLGYTYEEAGSGKEAIDMMKKTQYDAVLLDVEMPKMNGFEVVKHVREKMQPPKSETPVIAVTAHDPNTFMDDYKNSRFDTLVSKPYSNEKIGQVLHELGIA